METRELAEKLQQLIEIYRQESVEYKGPAKAFYLGKMVSLQEVLIWIIGDDDFSLKVITKQADIYTSIITAENSWVKLEELMERDGDESE